MKTGAFGWLAEAQRDRARAREYEVARKAALKDANRRWEEQDRANQREIEARQPWGSTSVPGALGALGGIVTSVGSTHDYWVYGRTTGKLERVDGVSTGRDENVGEAKRKRELLQELPAEFVEDEREYLASPLFAESDVEMLQRFVGSAAPGQIRDWFESMRLRVIICRERGYTKLSPTGRDGAAPEPAPTPPDPLPVERVESKPLVLDEIDVNNLE